MNESICDLDGSSSATTRRRRAAHRSHVRLVGRSRGGGTRRRGRTRGICVWIDRRQCVVSLRVNQSKPVSSIFLKSSSPHLSSILYRSHIKIVASRDCELAPPRSTRDDDERKRRIRVNQVFSYYYFCVLFDYDFSIYILIVFLFILALCVFFFPPMSHNIARSCIDDNRCN